MPSAYDGQRPTSAPTAETPAAESAAPGLGRTQRLAPVLGPFTAMALVVGATIGSGVFMKPAQVAQATGGHVGLILLLWIVCGVVNLCGALTLAELSAMLPHAGGAYVYLREAYGRRWGFLWVWAEFWVIRSGAIAALAQVFSLSVVPSLWQAWRGPAHTGRGDWLAEELAVTLCSLGTVAVLALLNAAGTHWGGALQNVTTVLKAVALAILIALPWLGAPVTSPVLHWWPSAGNWTGWAGLGAALAGIMWAYDGWGMVTVLAEEIRDPQRNVPRALAGGLCLLIVLYVGANVAYHVTLPVERIAAAEIPAADVAELRLPGWGSLLVRATLFVSVFGALNANILVGPRVLFAAARDHRRLTSMARIDPRTHTPAIAILAVAGWSMVLIVAGELTRRQWKPLFDVLTDYTIFGGSLFYFASVVAVFVLRRQHPEWPRPYRTWGYPWVPLLFSAFYVLLLSTMFVASPLESTAGLVLIGLGLLAYRWVASYAG